MRRAALLGPAVLAACVAGGEPDPDEATVPVEVSETCVRDVACGADATALIGTWRIERGCVARSNPVRDLCPDTVFHAHIQAAGTVSFGTNLMRFDVGTFAEYVVMVPAACAPSGCRSFEELVGFPPEACAATDDGGCRCPWSTSIDGEGFGVSYTLDGSSLLVGDGSTYDVCLLGDTLRLATTSFSSVDLDTMQLVRE